MVSGYLLNQIQLITALKKNGERNIGKKGMIESTIHFLKHLFGFCGEPHPNVFIGGIGLIGYCFNCCKNILNKYEKKNNNTR